MTGEQLRQLEANLWKAADDLRANSKLTATEYSFPVLGLIFLRHAHNRFLTAKEKIEKTLPVHPQRGRRPVNKDDFQTAKAIFLPENARWDTIAGLKEGADIGEALDEAMRSIEKEYEVLKGVLPKNYSLFEKDLLLRLIRIFNTEQLNNVTGDVFGRIYEYFLNEFAKTGAQEGGEFFTPPSLVNTIVNTIEPNHGIVFDCAVGSAGMFVQTGHFLEEKGFNPAKKVTFFGQEKTETNTKLAKMNMTVHGLDANIVVGNTFYEDLHVLTGKCDYVMANPPFNVDGVDKSKDSVKKDKRLPFGLPKNDNANYLWIQYFYSYLNEKGRAGFVMASSASDAGHSEYDIREKLVKTGAVDVMMSIGTKFFYTRSLPCSLWFFDRAKEKNKQRKDKTLMLDLRDVFRKVSSNLHDFSNEHFKSIKAIVGLYRNDKEPYKQAVADYKREVERGLSDAKRSLKEIMSHALKAEKLSFSLSFGEGKGEAKKPKVEVSELKNVKRNLSNAHKLLAAQVKALLQRKEIIADKKRRASIQQFLIASERLLKDFNEAADRSLYFDKELRWLTSRFSKAEYNDVAGLCKVVTMKEIVANDYSLTAGRYVGVAPQVDDDFDYEERMSEIKGELQSLNDESVELAQTIQDNLNELRL